MLVPFKTITRGAPPAGKLTSGKLFNESSLRTNVFNHTIGRVGLLNKGFPASLVTLVAGTPLPGSWKSAHDAAEAVRKLTVGESAAAAILKVGDEFKAVSLLDYDRSLFSDRAGNFHETHSYVPADLESNQGYEFGFTVSDASSLAYVVDGNITLAGPQLFGHPTTLPGGGE